MIQLWVATTSQGKLNEFRNILSKKAEIHSPAELKVYALPKETGSTFVENARIKAKALKALKPGEWVVADDSGLEVEGLGGLPGVHSARYAGEKASDAENNAKLLKMVSIRTAGNRAAQFRCVFVIYSPDGKETVIEGLVKGTIATAARGTTGFGYDPVFIPEGQTKTYAELGPGFKNQGSHRAQAIRQMAALLEPSQTS
jgi:XTP/dITP diphosphohydrolase